MTNSLKNQKSRSYFAAQNSYQGFISHFGKVFKSDKYDRIFVLKGGPGTGKSSLMKKLSKKLSEISEVTDIYCSSDIKSLDGVIARGKHSSVAILDGTSPHERDAVIAGAIDELVNLGEYWKTDGLIEQREEILSLSFEKSSNYKNAYSRLSVAGKYKELLLTEVLSRLDTYRARAYATELCRGNKSKDPPSRSLLLSAFGKDGYQTLPDSLSNYKNTIQITGEYFSAELFMKILCEELTKLNIEHKEFPSPLSHSVTETVVINDNDESFCYTLLPAEEKLSVNTFIRSLATAEVQLLHFEKERKKEETLAIKAFAKASDAHFKLEKIYTPLMDFEMISNTAQKIEKKALEILE